MSYESAYAWVVLCKNKKFHRRENVLFGHKIALGETDPFASPPTFSGLLRVRCDECGQEYSYKSDDLLRLELDLPDGFKPHLLFA